MWGRGLAPFPPSDKYKHEKTHTTMENTIRTNTKDVFTAVNGQIVKLQDILESIRISGEVFRRTHCGEMSGDDLADVFQNAALKVLKASSRYNPFRSSPKTWGSRIAGNCQIDAARRRTRHNLHFRPLSDLNKDGDEYESAVIAGYRGDEYEADRDIITEQSMAKIEAGINSLNENYQLIIRMTADGMKPKKIAELIGCTPGAISTLLCRARKALAAVLGSDFLSDHGIAA